MSEIMFADIEAAAERLKGHAQRTPIATSRQLNARVGAEVFCKCENLQRVGAFKFRGAMNMIRRLSEAERKEGVAAFSSGNHAQAVALSAKRLKMPAVIVMPHDSPGKKVGVVLSGGNVDSAPLAKILAP